MRRQSKILNTFFLPAAAVVLAASMLWQLGPATQASASPSVDGNLTARIDGAPASFADLIEAVQPAVVNIAVSGSATAGMTRGEIPPELPFEDFEEFLRRFFDRGLPGREARPSRPDVPRTPRRGPTFQGMGSGFLVSPEGHVVTNQHVVARASEITVTLHDGRKLAATVVGVDDKTDLAVLKVESREALPYARFGDSDQARVGDWVVAIGNPFGLGGSATAGIISARGRDIRSGPYDDFIQIDAPINRGNSGGPLFDLNGRVVGINTAIFSPNGGNVGIGFAIPANLAADVVEALRTTGRVDRGFLGVTIQSLDEDIAASLGIEPDAGALVASVVPGGPADKAGIQPGDVIVEIEGEKVGQVRDVTRKIASIAPDTRTRIVVLRNGERKTLEPVIGRNPAEAETAGAGAPGPGASAPAGGIGVGLAELTPGARERFGIADDVQGALIVQVDPGSAAAEKGLRPGDVIVGVGRTPVTSVDEAKREIERRKAEARGSLLLRVVRQGDALFVAVPTA